jgi:hypothetical protein
MHCKTKPLNLYGLDIDSGIQCFQKVVPLKAGQIRIIRKIPVWLLMVQGEETDMI